MRLRRPVATALVAALIASIVALVPLADPPPAAAGPADNFSLAKTDNVGGEALIGEQITYTLTATGTQASNAYLYNLSFRDVLPVGVTFVSSSPAPTAILDDVPNAGETTLIWENVNDLPADSNASLDYVVDTNPDFAGGTSGSSTVPVGSTISNSAQAVASLDATMIPDWSDIDGTFTGDFEGEASAGHNVDVIPFRVTKTGPGELLRGVHTNGFGGRTGSAGGVWTIEVENNPDYATSGVTLLDVLGPQLEFLGCDTYYPAGDDNSTDVPFRESASAADEEWAGSGPMATGTGPCATPTDVNTVDAGVGGGLANTELTWDVGNLAPGATSTITYHAGFPMRANTTTWTTSGGSPSSASLDQGRNLDNNAGPSTNELDATINTDPELLTDGAVAATNTATASGTYTPSGALETQADQTTTEAEDLHISKSSSGALVHASTVSNTLTVTAGEYRDFTDLVVRDLLPSGLCYLGTFGVDTTPGGSDWNTTDCPGAGLGTASSASVRELPDGGPYGTGRFEIVWDKTSTPGLADLDSDQSIAIPYTAVVRSAYRGSLTQLPGEPVLAGDQVTNRAEVSGPDFVVASHTNDGGADDEPDAGIDGDTASAGLTNTLPSIDKRVSAKLGPLADAAGATASTCGASYGAITWQDSLATGFGPGDIVCFEVGASFPSQVDYENVTVQDLLPPGHAYIPGSATRIASVDDLPGTTFTESTLRWDLGTVDNPGHQFLWVIATRVGVPDDGRARDINANQQKMTHNQNAGVVFQYRDDVSAEWTEPELSLAKGVKQVDAPDAPLDAGPHSADWDGSTSGGSNSAEVEGDTTVTFRVDVTNGGNKDALNVEVWDVLPTDFTCAEISGVSHGGTCASGTVSWSLATVAAGANTELTYVLTTPPDIEPSQSWTNTAGVRAYQAQTNDGLQDYYPRDNVDGTATPNTDAADDDAFLHTASPSVAKAQASGIDESGNGSNGAPGTALDQATIGEIVQYQLELTIPDGTNVFDGVLSDALHSSLRYFTGSARFGGATPVLAPTVVSSDVDADGDRLDGGTLTVPAVGSSGTVSYTLPADYQNPADGADHKVTITFYVQLMSGSRGNTRTNAAVFSFDDSDASPLPTATSNTVQIRVVEPLPTVSKSHTVPAGSAVAPGDVITYQVVALNSSASNVSVLHDVTLVDSVPVGITPVRAGGGLVSANGHLVASAGVNPTGGFTGTWSETNREITWTQSDWAPLASIDRGANRTFTYQAEVDDPATASGTILNSVDIEGFNLDDADPNTADGRSYADDDSDLLNLPDATLVKDIEPLPNDGDDRANVTVGEPLDFDVVATIPTNTRAYDMTVFDDLPAGLTFDSFGTITVAGSCDVLPGPGPLASGDVETFGPPVGGSATRVAWFIGDVLANGGPCTVTARYTAFVDNSAVAADVLTNSANLRWNTGDNVADAAPSSLPTAYDAPGDAWDSAEGPDSESIPVVEPQLELDEDVTTPAGASVGACDNSAGNNRTGSDDNDSEAGPTDGCDIEAGATLRYTLTVSNVGTADAHDTQVVDTLPSGLEPLVAPGGAVATDGAAIVGASGSTGTWDAATRTITWNLAPAIAATTGTVTLDFDVAVDPSVDLIEGQDMTTVADVNTYYALDAATRAGISTGHVPTYGNAGGASRGSLLPDSTTVEVHFPVLAITKGAVDDLSDARFDTPFTWLLIVQNTSASANAFDIEVEDTLPTGWAYVTGSAQVTTPYGGPTAVEPAVAGQDLTWSGLVSGSLEPLAPGTQVIVQFDATPSSTTLAPDSATGISNTGPANPHTNSSSVTALDASGATGCCDTGTGPIPYADTDTADAIIRRADLSVDKSIVDTPPIYHGDIVTYVVELTNGGPSAATGVTLTDVFAPDHVYVGTSVIDAGTFNSGTFTWNVGTIPSGTTYELRVQLEIDANGVITNTAGVETADQWDPDSTPGNDVLAEDDEDSVTITALGSDLGNRVWLDLDADGIQDFGEPGIPGVAVYVSWTDAGGNPQVRSVTTDTDGNWNVNGLPVDTALTVTVDPGTPATPAGSGGLGTTLPTGLTPTWELADSPVVTSPQAGNGHVTGLDHETAGIVLTLATDSYLDVDFGYVGINSLGDELWFDADAGGESAPETGDVPLVGADLTLTWAGFDNTFGTSDDLTFGDTTDAAGLYLFAGLPDGTYRVTVDDTTLPAGATATYDLDGSGTANHSGPFDLGVGLTVAHDRRDVDFAYTGAGSVGDTVWFDLDLDGLHDPEEVALEGVRVTSTFTLPGGNVVTLETFTDADGQYLFTALPLDLPITINVDPSTIPVGLDPTYDLDGTGTAHQAVTTLTSGDPDRRDVDFGYAGAGEIGDHVWLDVDGSATATPDPDEPGLGGVTVTLTWDNPTAADDLVVTTVTATDGSYLFPNLPAGDYTIALSGLPGGVDPSFDPDGGADFLSQTTLGVGASDLDQDFSVVGLGSIGDTVWHDANADGVLDVDEDPIAGVDLTVVWVDPITGSSHTINTSTDTGGAYLASGLPAGDYTVSVDSTTVPVGFAPTYDLDDGLDHTTDLVLGTGEDRRDLDFGYRLEVDLTISKTHNEDFRVGELNRWELSVANHGPAAASAPVTVTDTLPDGIEYERVEGADWSCTETTGTITCTYVDGAGNATDFAASDSSELSIVVTPTRTAAPAVVNSATVESTTPDTDPANNSDDDPTDVPLAVLSIEKTREGRIRTGAVITYILEVSNAGPSPTSGRITVTDALPVGLDYVSSDAPTGVACGSRRDVVTCTTERSVAVGDSFVIEIDARVTANSGTRLVNNASVEGGNEVAGSPLSDDVLTDAGAQTEDSASGEVEAASALPFTGSNSVTLAWLAAFLLIAGAAALTLRRKLDSSGSLS